LRRSVLDLTDVYVFGSGGVSAQHETLPPELRRSIDVDFSPIAEEDRAKVSQSLAAVTTPL
jgi:hypothetical protein